MIGLGEPWIIYKIYQGLFSLLYLRTPKPSSPKSSVAKLSLSSQPTSSSSFNALRKSFPFQTPLSVSSPSCFLVRPFSHLAWIQTDRKSGGLGDLKYPLVSDVTKSISESYDVLIRIRVSH